MESLKEILLARMDELTTELQKLDIPEHVAGLNNETINGQRFNFAIRLSELKLLKERLPPN